jgi:hypothetical protein
MHAPPSWKCDVLSGLLSWGHPHENPVQQTENVPITLLKHMWLPSYARPASRGMEGFPVRAGRRIPSVDWVHITSEIITFSATFMLIAAMNPYP